MTPEDELTNVLLDRFHTAVDDDGLCHVMMAAKLWYAFTLLLMKAGARPTELSGLLTDLYAGLLRVREEED